jgi:hypothetical protein
MESNNKLIKVNQPSLTEVMTTADMFYKSGMFKDVASVAQCVVKIQAGAEIGLPPFASMTGISVIKGKPVIGAGVMASKIKSSNKYDYKVIELSNTKCSIDFFLHGELIDNSTFTIDDARKAGTGAGDNGSGKMIDKFPKNMLFARAISNGVKFYCPDIFFTSFYDPGEMSAAVEGGAIELEYTEVVETEGERLTAFLRLVDEQYFKCFTLPELDFMRNKILTLKDGKYSGYKENESFKSLFYTHEARVNQDGNIVNSDEVVNACLAGEKEFQELGAGANA